MHRVEAIKSVLLDGEAVKPTDDDVRGAEGVEPVWDESVHGAWAPGKASLSLLTTFLSHIQAQETAPAIETARHILDAEPGNALVRDLLEALKAQEALEIEEEAEADDDAEEAGEEADDDDGSDEESGEESEASDSEENESESESDGDDAESDKATKETPESGELEEK